MINDRLRDYIERMLSVIIEHNPQMLEVTTSAGLSIGSLAMPSISAPVSLPSPSNTTVTDGNGKNPADKNCRL